MNQAFVAVVGRRLRATTFQQTSKNNRPLKKIEFYGKPSLKVISVASQSQTTANEGLNAFLKPNQNSNPNVSFTGV